MSLFARTFVDWFSGTFFLLFYPISPLLVFSKPGFPFSLLPPEGSILGSSGKWSPSPTPFPPEMFFFLRVCPTSPRPSDLPTGQHDVPIGCFPPDPPPAVQVGTDRGMGMWNYLVFPYSDIVSFIPTSSLFGSLSFFFSGCRFPFWNSTPVPCFFPVQLRNWLDLPFYPEGLVGHRSSAYKRTPFFLFCLFWGIFLHPLPYSC